jgi:fatty-acyl-CoA synthase
MLGLMMDMPLQLSRLIDYAGEHHGSTQVVARRTDGSVERDDWAGMRSRAKRLAAGLQQLGLTADMPVASLTWNTLDHVELFYAVLGLGIPLHTLNPRLSINDLGYMIDRVADRVCFFDRDTLPIASAIARETRTIERWVLLDGGEALAGDADLPGLLDKADLLATDDGFAWPEIDERSAATICFTSGTTGRPKGVVYSHRSLTLGAMNMSMADMYANERNGELVVVMPNAPIFHANGWLMPFTAPMNGHKLVLPGRDFSAPSIVELMAAEGVTIAAGVPTLWNDLINEMERSSVQIPSLRTALVAGTTLPPSLFDALDRRGISVRQTWGMTEVPGATRASLSPGSAELSEVDRKTLERDRQGRVAFHADLRIVDEQGAKLPHDGQAAGSLQVRGPLVAARYLGEPAEATVEWLDTGDIARIHPDGSLEIVDRAKDVIKSGGEWISSPQLEAAATSHPAVDLAAAIAVPHPRWQERPMLLCTLKPGASATADELREHMGKSLARWWLPEEIRFIDHMPTTPTGKISKLTLREKYAKA